MRLWWIVVGGMVYVVRAATAEEVVKIAGPSILGDCGPVEIVAEGEPGILHEYS